MTSHSSPPEIDIKAEYCPEAVIEWHRLSGLEDRKESLSRKDLALKAKQHLFYLKWKFWHVNKKGKWELRYTSPVNGKNYISLRKACESCIEDGGCSTIPSSSSTTVQVPSTIISSPERPKDFGETDQSIFNEDSGDFTLQKCNVTTIDGGYSTIHSSTIVQVPLTTTFNNDSQVFSLSSLQKHNDTTISEDGGRPIIHSPTTMQPPSVTISSSPLNLKKRPRDFGEIDQSTFNEYSKAFSSYSQNCNVTAISTSKINEHVSTSKSEVTKSQRPYKRQKISNMSTMDKNLEDCDQNEKVLNMSILEDNSEVFEKREEVLNMSTREGCTFISSLVKNRVLVPGTNVFCRGSNNIVKIGSIVFDGISCHCCQVNFNITEFETHAGCTRNSPPISIMLEDGRSMLECQKVTLNLNLHD
ncbi:uncharacterized protein LOC131605948 [Vicia villosa]|uniref:uncharacterized protein LOC131605948 n=1 Tax=Vicia villosa TaxID=3911 RepID=UPI00273A7936|nr:uncharacterized protein LOC131605948 [Vicia villosa]